MLDKLPQSALDQLIRPEIKNDRFYRLIAKVAATDGVYQILEIGSAAGDGSTEAFVLGALRNRLRPVLHCLEISRVRFAALCACASKELPYPGQREARRARSSFAPTRRQAGGKNSSIE